MEKYLALSIAGLIFVLVFSVMQSNPSFAESANSIEQKILNVLQGTGNVLADKQSFIVDGLLKTSYRITYPADEKELDGSVIIWSDVDGKDVKEVEISTSHYNDPESRFTAAVVLALVKTGFLSNAELNNEVFFGMIDDAIDGKETTIVTTSGYKVNVNEIIVVEGTPGLGMLFLTVEYSPKTFTSTPSPSSIQTNKKTENLERTCIENYICAFSGDFLRYRNTDSYDNFSEIAVVDFKEKINDRTIRVFIDGFGSKPLTYTLDLKTGNEKNSQYNVDRPFNLMEPIPMKIGQKVFRIYVTFESTLTDEVTVDFKNSERTFMVAKTDLGRGDSVIRIYDKETGVLISSIETYGFDGKQYKTELTLIETNMFSEPTNVSLNDIPTSKTVSKQPASPLEFKKGIISIKGDCLDPKHVYFEEDGRGGVVKFSDRNVINFGIYTKISKITIDCLTSSFIFEIQKDAIYGSQSVYLPVEMFGGYLTMYVNDVKTEFHKGEESYDMIAITKPWRDFQIFGSGSVYKISKMHIPSSLSMNKQNELEKTVTSKTSTSDLAYENAAQLAKSRFESSIIQLKFGLNEAEKTLSALEFDNIFAQRKIEHAKSIHQNAIENLKEAEKKLSAGVYELEKQNFQESLEFFNRIDSNEKEIRGVLRDIDGYIDEANELGNILQLQKTSRVPDWIKNNAKWWSEGSIGDGDFTSGIQFMIKENIMVIPDLPEEVTQMELKDEKRAMGLERDKNVPDWVRNNAGWWADGLISDDDFVSGIKYLVEQGIIKV